MNQMDQQSAVYLLAGLLERIQRDQIGMVSMPERDALKFTLEFMRGEKLDFQPLVTNAPQPPTPPMVGKTPPVEPLVTAPASLPKLVLDSLSSTENFDPDILLCLDFGTAMSKAFAKANLEPLELDLGTSAGQSPSYTLPSSVFIGDDGKAYFGFEAVDCSQGLVESDRQRLDSIKGWLSLRHEGNLDSLPVESKYNPTSFKITQGDMIRLYLAYLTDMAVTALGKYEIKSKPIGRYVKRRFARPCWSGDAQTQWADKQMRDLLAEAQILADTFTGHWKGGIDLGQLKAAIDQMKVLNRRPDYLIAEGIPEPVAVAAGAIANSKNLRDAFMVVDVGAGTTDFGLFVATKLKDSDDFKVFQVPSSIQGLNQAGDKVDNLLRIFIARKENIDSKDINGSMIIDDLVRRIRGMKEALFTSGSLEYALSDHTVGVIKVEEFLADPAVQRFGAAIEEGFRKSLAAVDESWLRWLAMEGVRLHVVLTGGSSQLPMMRTLDHGDIEVKGFHIRRVSIDPKPDWIEDNMPELLPVYPQLAVAIGGSADELPETFSAPPVFLGGGTRTQYVAGRLQISGT